MKLIFVAVTATTTETFVVMYVVLRLMQQMQVGRATQIVLQEPDIVAAMVACSFAYKATVLVLVVVVPLVMGIFAISVIDRQYLRCLVLIVCLKNIMNYVDMVA